MSTTTKRLLVGGALTGAVVLGIGAPALAQTHGVQHHQHAPHSATVTTTAPTVQIGTAVQYVRNTDGTISVVTPR